MKKYTITLYYHSSASIEVEAIDEDQARDRARSLVSNEDILENLIEDGSPDVEEHQEVPEDAPAKNFTYGGLKIKFAPGNLYWDGKQFRFEEHQYDSPDEWDPEHIGHFFWSKDAAKAGGAKYSDPGKSVNDKFFAADGGAIEGWTILSVEQWRKVIKNCLAKNRAVIAGKCCAILKPDGTEYEVKDSYSTDEWKEAERHGLVALPFAGSRYGSDIDDTDSYGYYWSSTPYSSNADYAWNAYFYSYGAYMDYYYRHYGYSVRLVSVQ